jgi:hypothetical protein
MPSRDAKALQTAPLATPTDLKPDAVRDIGGALNAQCCTVMVASRKRFQLRGPTNGPRCLTPDRLNRDRVRTFEIYRAQQSWV